MKFQAIDFEDFVDQTLESDREHLPEVSSVAVDADQSDPEDDVSTVHAHEFPEGSPETTTGSSLALELADIHSSSYDQLFFERVLSDPRSTLDIDCPTKSCFLEYHVLPTCTLHIANSNPDCDIPCNLDACSIEIKHFFDCPVWTCKDKISTLAPETTTLPPPFPPRPSGPNYGLLYASVAFNVAFLAIIGFRLSKFLYLRRSRSQNRSQTSDPESGIIRGTTTQSSQEHFVLDDTPSEASPLLSQPTRSQTGGETQASLMERLRNFRYSFTSHRWVDSSESNGPNESSTPSETGSLNPTAPPGPV